MLAYLSAFCFFIAAISTGDCRSFRSIFGNTNHHFEETTSAFHIIPECFDGGKAYPVGEIFHTERGDCMCGPDHGLHCEEHIDTSPPPTSPGYVSDTMSVPPPVAECFHEGKVYHVGETFHSMWGECMCTLDHGIQCKLSLRKSNMRTSNRRFGS
ncbi:Hypothetical predicted protein [Octopus vulgaris]|uniref:EGF-like domain-containing protein n=1 Tax=Octopus vulgaris TaxID=6645 RepID=A0AA36BY57_OCTVU|nr:Hypothetical predicted protein [Octopus vulgaris]